MEFNRKSIKIKIIGPVLLPDGYGEMTREFARSLIDNEINISIRSILFNKNCNDTEKVNADDLLEYIEDEWIDGEFKNRNDDCDVIIQCLTPNNFPVHYINGKLNIGYTMWETDKLPDEWVSLCNMMDKILVPSTFSLKVFKNSNVDKVNILPIPSCINKFDRLYEDKALSELIGDNYSFYSIFQWSERKNPEALLKSYYSAFQNNEKVVLVLKTYINSDDKYNATEIPKRISEIKNNIRINNNSYPRIICMTERTSDLNIKKIHKTCDCYLAPVRGEGFGLPVFDAMLCNNDIIATDDMAYVDFLDTYSYLKYQSFDLIPYQLDFVHNMNGLYTSRQKWAEIDRYKFISRMLVNYKRWETGDKEFKNRVATDRKEYVDKCIRPVYNYKNIADNFLFLVGSTLNSKS